MIQLRTEFLNGRRYVWNARGRIVLSATLYRDGIHLVDPIHVEYLMTGRIPRIGKVRAPTSSTEMPISTNADPRKDPVKLYNEASHLGSITGGVNGTNI